LVAFFIAIFYLIVAAHCSSLHVGRINKRYYDAWEPNNDVDSNGNDEAVKSMPSYHKGLKKVTPCENKPLWFLKNQVRLGKSSPYYDCLVQNELEKEQTNK
jgi:hypothetical protein